MKEINRKKEKVRKTVVLLLSVLLLAGSAYAGGSIFGHKKKSSNAYGVYSVNMHVCKSLDCGGAQIEEGKCTKEHQSMQYGVCTCDDGYFEKDGECIEVTEENCTESGKKWCSASNTCADSDDCCTSISVPECQICDSATGALADNDDVL